jgi:hypothetical protein
VLGMLTILIFHCARFFNDEDWHIKNNRHCRFTSCIRRSSSSWIFGWPVGLWA